MAAFKPTADPRTDPLGFARELQDADEHSFSLPADDPFTELSVRAALYEVTGMGRADAWTKAIDDCPALLTEMQTQTIAEFASRPPAEVQQTLAAIAAVRALREGGMPPGSPATITDTSFITDPAGRITGKRTIELRGA